MTNNTRFQCQYRRIKSQMIGRNVDLQMNISMTVSGPKNQMEIHDMKLKEMKPFQRTQFNDKSSSLLGEKRCR